MSGMDPIVLEVLWNRLLSVVNEQQVALMRTAFSTIVRETQDLACGVFNTEGAMVAQSLTGTPGHINAMATGMRHLLERYQPDSLSDGDVILTNDPWMTAGQINDITVATPVFRSGRIVGVLRQHLPRGGHRRENPVGGGPGGLRGGPSASHHEAFPQGGDQSGPDQDNQSQRTDSRRDGGRPLRADHQQRGGRPGATQVHGRVQPRFHRSRSPGRSWTGPRRRCANR